MNAQALHSDDCVDQEVWLPVVGFVGVYEVSNFGRVRSLDRTVPHGLTVTRRQKGRVLSPIVDEGGYLFVHLGAPPPRRARVHILVLEAFVGPRPVGLNGPHGDDVKLNNHLSNLRWGTQSENVADGWRNTRSKEVSK